MTNATSKSSSEIETKKLPIGNRMLVLEPRYVFDAALAGELADLAQSDGPPENFAPVPDGAGAAIVAAANELAALDGGEDAFAADAGSLAAEASRAIESYVAAHNLTATSREIAFIDERLADLGTLVSAIPDGMRIVLIDGTRDGVAQMAEALSRENGITGVHIISHGNAGEIGLGTAVLNAETMASDYATLLNSFRASLSADADILVYGCNFAAGEAGAAAVAALADLTGADVAASEDLTGAGGDWDLERRLGAVDAATVGAADYDHALALTNTGAWTVAGSTATNTTDGVTTTVTFTAGAGTSFTSIANETLNTIDVFSNAAQGGASLSFVYNWDTTPEPIAPDEPTIPQHRADADGGTGTITITFSKPVTDPIINLDRIGGFGAVQITHQNPVFPFNTIVDAEDGRTNSAHWTLTTPGATLTELTGVGHFDTTATTIERTPDVLTPYSGTSTQSGADGTLNTAAGSFKVNGTFTTLTFQLTGVGVEGSGGDGMELRFSVDAPPAAIDDAFTGTEDTTVTGNLFADNGAGADSDPTGDALTVTHVNGVAVTQGVPVTLANGTLTITDAATGAFTFEPNAGFTGVQAFDYTIADPASGTDTAAVTITIEPAPLDTDSDGVADTIDIDDDNDGITDEVESDLATQTITFDRISAIPVGTYSGNPAGLRVSDATGQYVVDIFLNLAAGSASGQHVTFDTVTGRIGNGTETINDGEYVALTYTTANSPTPWQINDLTINDINSLSPFGSGVRDSYAFSQPGTWTPIGSPAGAVYNVSYSATNGVGSLASADPDGAEGEVINFAHELIPLSPSQTLSQVLNNPQGSGNGHTARMSFDDPQTTVDLFIFDALHGQGGAMLWNFFPQFTARVEVDADSDGLANSLDIDSDDDGITDNIEAQTTDGYVAPSGAGIAMLDANNDGLDDVYGPAGLTPVNTDGVDAVDYLDLDTDNDAATDNAENGLGVAMVAPLDADTDGDGLKDVYEVAIDGDANDGYVVSEGVTDPLNAETSQNGYLPDDGDAVAGSIVPMSADLNYRDATLDNDPPLLVDPDPAPGTPSIDPVDPTRLLVPAVDDVALSLPLGPYFTDPDGDPRMITPDMTSAPAWLSYDPVTQTFSGTPPADNTGPVTIPVTVSDGRGGSFTGSIVFEITNPGPDAVDDASTTPYLTPVVVDLPGNDTDPDGDPLTVTSAMLADPTTGTLAQDPVTGAWTFTPAVGFSGDAVINYTITDQDGATDTAIHTVTVRNAPPTLIDPAPGVPGSPEIDPANPTNLLVPATDGAPLSLPLAAYFVDPNGTPVTISINPAALPSWLTYDPVTQTLAGTPPVDNTGNLTIIPAIVTDNMGDTYLASVTIVPANPSPDAVVDGTTTPFETAVAVALLSNDTDPDNDPLAVTSATLADPTTGTLTQDPASGAWIFTPADGFSGDVVINYAIRDQDGGTDTATHTVTVTPDPRPSVTLDPNNSGGGANDGGYSTTYTENQVDVAVALVDADALVFDNFDDITSMQIVVGGIIDGDAEVVTIAGQAFPLATSTVTPAIVELEANRAAISYDAVTGTFAVTNADLPGAPLTGGDLTALLKDMRYRDEGEAPTAGDRTLTITVTDQGGLTSVPVQSIVTVIDVDDAPIISLSVVSPGDVVVVDMSLPDVESLLDGVPAGARIIQIPAGAPGVATLAHALSTMSDVGALHILSHGTSGQLNLGSDLLTMSSIAGQYAADLAIIGSHLGANGDILVYGCKFGASASAMHALATATGADIAASSDDTGDAAQGGDWDLEITYGAVEAAMMQALEYPHLLAPQLTSLNFGSPAVEFDNPAGLIGDQWRYTAVAPGVDAIVEVVAVNGTVTSLANIDASASGRLSAFQPEVRGIPSEDAGITFKIKFVEIGTTTPATVTNIVANGIDVDGQGATAQEMATWNTIDTVYIEPGSQLTLDAPAPNPTIHGTQTGFAGIDVEQTVANYSVFYAAPVSELTFTLGISGTGTSAVTRQSSVSFGPADIEAYDSPVAVPDYASTPGNTPVTFQILDNDWGGEQGADGGRAETPLDLASVDLDPSTPGQQTSFTVAGQGTFTYNGDGTVTFTPLSGFSGDVTPISYTVDNTVTADNPAVETSNVGAIRIAVEPAPNNPPAVVAPGFSTPQDTPVPLTGISFSDPDVGTGDVTVTLAVGAGTLDILGDVPGGLTAAQISGDGTGTLTLTGPIDAINATLAASNGLVYMPPAGDDADQTLDITIDDLGGSGQGGPLNTATSVPIVITPVNAPPVLVDPAPGVPGSPEIDPANPSNLLVPAVDNAPLTLDAGDFFTDPNGDPLTITPDMTGVPSWLTYDPVTQTFSGTPPVDNTGTDIVIPVMVDDGKGGAYPATITVQATNPAPDAVDGTVTTPFETPVVVDLLANDSDPDGDPLTVTSATLADPASGTLTQDPVTGAWTFTPAPGFSGDAVITYTITDQDGATDTAIHTVTVENALPKLVDPDPATGPSIDPANPSNLAVPATDGTPLTLDAGDYFTDPNGDPLTITPDMTGVPGWLSYDPVTQTFSGTPPVDNAGADIVIPVMVDDGKGGAYPATITVQATNPAPDAVDGTVTTPFETPVVVDLLANDSDPDGDPLTVTSATLADPASGTLTQDPVTGAWTFTPAAGFSGDAVITYTITDQDGATDTAIHTVTVENALPKLVDPDPATGPSIDPANPSNLAVPATDGTPLTLDAGDYFTDPNGDPLTITPDMTGVPGWLSYDPVTQTFSGNPPVDNTGLPVVIPVTVSDGKGGTVDTTITFTPTNPGPTAVDGTISTAYDTPVVVPLLTNDTDADGDTLTVVSATLANPADGTLTLDPVTGVWTFTPAAGFTGSAVINYTMADQDGATDTAVHTVDVAAPARPVAVNDSYNIPFGSTLNGNVAPNDTFTPGSTFSLLSQPANGTVTFNPDGTYTYVPAAGFVGTETFVYEVTDPAGQKALAVEVIRVQPPSIAVVNDAYTTPFNTPLNGNAAANDTVAPGSTFTAITAPVHGTVTFNADGTYVYTPNAGFSGVDLFAYAVTDPSGQTRFATETITVQPPPGPDAVDDSYTTPYATALSGNAATGDSFGAGATFAAVTQPAHGTLVFNADGTYIYSPAAGFAGTDTFTYSVTNANGSTDTATETIIVSPPALNAVDDSYSTPYNTPVNGNAASGDTFAPGSTFAVATQPAVGAVTMNASGTFQFTPPASFAGTVTFSYRVTDPTGQTRTATETIVVGAPQLIAVNDNLTTPFNTPLNGNAAGNDTYPAGSVFAATSVPLHGTVSMNANGTYVYTPASVYSGTDTFTYSITDPTGRVVTATQTITIEPQRSLLHRCLTTFGQLRLRR